MVKRGYRLLSYAFSVRSDVSGAGERLDRLLAPFRSACVNGGPAYVIRDARDGNPSPLVVEYEGACVQRAKWIGPLVDYVLWDASGKAIERTDAFLVLHAGVVSRRGRGVLLPAPPDSGKTTLAAGLTVAGFSYLTDEAALVDPRDGRTHPYPRALWIEDPSLPALAAIGKELPPPEPATGRRFGHVSPHELRPRSIGGPCRIRFAIAPQYERGSTTVLEPMSRGEALVLLAENSFNLRHFGGDGIRLLGRLVRGAECYRLHIGDLVRAVRLVSEVVGG